MTLEEKKSKLMNSLIDRQGMQHIMDTAREVFENPVFVSDLSFNTLCYSKDELPGDRFWNEVSMSGFASEFIIKQFNYKGQYEQLYSKDEPRLSTFPFSDHPFLAARLRGGTNVIGHVCVYLHNRPVTDEDAKLIITLCKVLVYEILYRSQSATDNSPFLHVLTDILDGKTIEAKRLTHILANVKYRIPERICVVIMQYKEGEQSNTIYYVREHIVNKLLNSLTFIHNKTIVILCDITNKHKESNFDTIQRAAAGYNMQAGVSREFSDIADMPSYYLQAKGILEAVVGMSFMEDIHFYNTHFIYHMLHILSSQTDLKFFCDPKLAELLQYDRNNDTDLTNTLEVYLNCGRKINAAAEKLCIHKNSMYYRKIRIEELLDIELVDEEVCFQFQLSLFIMKYLLQNKH